MPEGAVSGPPAPRLLLACHQPNTMTPSRPYLIRAIHEWIIDNELTPYMLVDAEMAGVVAPMEFAENGKLVLNVNPPALDSLLMDNQQISFRARFQGKAMDVLVPVEAVLAIYARENGRGMVFSEEDGHDPSSPDTPPGKHHKPNLKVVK